MNAAVYEYQSIVPVVQHPQYCHMFSCFFLDSPLWLPTSVSQHYAPIMYQVSMTLHTQKQFLICLTVLVQPCIQKSQECVCSVMALVVIPSFIIATIYFYCLQK